MVAATQHDRFVTQDYDAILELGMRTVREGIRWPVIERSAGNLDFSSVRPFLDAARQRGMEIIWDLFHFGWPDHLDIFSEGWLDAFERLAEGFARVVKAEWKGPAWIAPMNEISFVAWAGGDTAYINPFQRHRGHDLKRQLVRAYVRAAAVVRRILPDARLISPEPVIHIVGRPGVPGDDRDAEAYRMAMFEAWDMVLGRVHQDLGGGEDNIGVIGTNFYDRNEWYNFGATIHRTDPDYRPFSEILKEVYERYRRPLFVSETGTEDDARAGWFAYISEEVRKAIDKGVPVEGICLYPILNHPGWDDDRHCHNGLFDYASPGGARAIHEPLAEEIFRQEEIRTTTGELKA